MDILSSLNPAQQQAVKIVNGPVLVLAGPGSGKTRVLTHRVAYLIGERHIAPYNILAVTFTNKAAREMRERLIRLIGEDRAQDLTIGTFHATCARFLRRDGERVGLSRGFAIYDEDDQTALIKQILKEMNLDDKKYKPGAVLGTISKAKNELIEPENYVPASYWHEVVGRVYQRYQQLLATNNAVDFDDLLMATVRLFREHPDILARYQNRYVYLHVDEFQDTNVAQYELMKLLASKYQNLFCVGDEDQCVLPGTRIQTHRGTKPIERVRVGDILQVAAGRGKLMNAPVEQIHRQTYRGQIIEIVTQRGHTLRVTPNHMLFARLGLAPDVYYVYLMYRIDRGYRIGLAKGTRTDGVHEQPFTGLIIRGNQENADKVWILRVCYSRSEAIFYEQYFAFAYGIPTTVFHSTGRKMQMTNGQIETLFADVDTRSRAQRLMADWGLWPEFPHHRPKGIAGDRLPHRMVVNLRLFGDTRRTEASPWHAHRVSLNTSDRTLERTLHSLGFHTRAGRRNTWRIESSNLDYDRADTFARRLAKLGGNLELARFAFLTETRSMGGVTLPFEFQPASQIHPTMIVPVLEDGQVVDDVVVRVTRAEYQGPVYDLDIPQVHNYIANNVIVHNSIYGWRGADYRNVLRFSQDFPNAQVCLLEQNYRSTQTILDVAQAIIRKNKSRHKKKLWTENPQGIPITIWEAYDQDEEASMVVDEIARLAKQGYRPRDCAVFYRTNFQSRALEAAFTRRGMPYQLIGALRFYQRREVKDILAYLRLIANPDDSVAFNRVLNVPPRGIGKNTMDNLARWAEKLNVSPYAILHILKEMDFQRPKISEHSSSVIRPSSLPADAFDARSRKSLLAFVNLLDELGAARTEQKLTELVKLVLQKTAYEDYIVDGTPEGEDRWQNVRELVNATKKYASEPAEITLPQFLEEAALIADIDTMRDDVDAPTLMTLHTAKGLEFRVVFIVGLEEGLFPHSRSFDEPAQMEEERRLCYVGITRAKERLYLVHSFRRSFYGNTEPSEPSRYLADIPQHLIAGTTLGRLDKGGKKSSDDRRASYFTHRRGDEMDDDDLEIDETLSPRQTKSHSSRTESRQFNAGDQVMHPTFGAGVVIASKITGTDEEVQVAFPGIGVKRLVARYANLQKK